MFRPGYVPPAEAAQEGLLAEVARGRRRHRASTQTQADEADVVVATQVAGAGRQHVVHELVQLGGPGHRRALEPLEAERALGRLGRGLERVRRERNLHQSDLARLAGVTPSAISQAEAGRRGLSLDTLLVLSERLGMGLDELLASAPTGGYVLARHPRTSVETTTALLDDPKAGLRAYLVRLGPGESGAPDLVHKGAELVLVASGLVQLTIGSDTPVMRAGDAVRATTEAVSGWRNLMNGPALLFWVLRDEPPKRAAR